MAAEKEQIESSLPAEYLAAVERAAERERDEPVVATAANNEQVTEPTAEAVETPAVVAETPAEAVDPVETQPVAEEKSGDGEATPTIPPELAEVARQYGLSDEDVADFSPDELKKAMRLLNREAVKLLQSQQATQPVQAAAATPEKPAEGTATDQATNPPVPPEAAAPTIEQQIQSLRDKGWDEDILALHRLSLEKAEKLEKHVMHMDGYLRQRSNAEMQNQQQAQQRAQQERTTQMLQGIDGLKRDDLFGSATKAPTEEQSRNLSAMRESIETLQVLQHRRGLNPALTSELVRDAYEITFRKQLQHEAAKSKATAVLKQSRSIMGQGRKATVPPKSIPVDESNVASHPRIKEFFAAIKAESA